MFAVADAEIRKLRHDPLELIMRAVQPTLWLVVFGQVMSRVRGVPTGRLSYLDFMAPGILARASCSSLSSMESRRSGSATSAS
jgi:ABC-2 type transport system permease protein